MISKLLLPFTFLALPLCSSLCAAGSPEQEYQQIRKIALRDPKVRAAYDEADRRLLEKMIRIDPALESYARRRAVSGPEIAPAPQKFRPLHSAPPAAHSLPPHGSGKVHVVAQGETLTSIAAQHGVTVTALKEANHNPDEKHLRVGQSLNLP